MSEKMKYFSMFSGIGGFELGIQRAIDIHSRMQAAGEQQPIEKGCTGVEKSGPIPLSCLGFSEIDKYATQIYKKHFPKHKEYGDVSKITWDDVEDFDLLVGGFPCQSFSIAGKRKGFNDIRGTLFFEIARAAQEKQPRLLLLENVKGLLSHDKGKTFGIILNTLDELGYDLQWQVLNSKNQGVPQNRERVFIVGHLRGTRRPEVFPIGEGNQKPVKSNAQRNDIAHTLTNADKYRGSYIKEITNGKLDDRTLASTAGFQENGNLSSMQEKKEKDGFSPQERGLAQPPSNEHSRSMSQLPQQNTSSQRKMQNLRQTNERSGVLRQTLSEIQKVRQSENVQKKSTYSNYRIRRLTPLEAERLQGFPDGWTLGISDTQRYKCLGNAVTVNVIKAIMSKLIAQ